jgi:non-ribosomal peptide synthetase component F
VDHFRNLVNAVLANPDERVSQIPLMDRREREQILLQWNDTAKPAPRDVRIEAAFERQANASPDSTALVFEGKKFTYKRINEKANQLAHYLIAKGIRPGTLVAVSVERSPDLTVALLAALKAGAAYVPLDYS